MTKIYITGHISPDLDSIASAYTYAKFLKEIKRYKEDEIIPVRVGDCNKETEFIFNKFNIEIPKHLDEYKIEDTDSFILVDHNEESQRYEKIDAEKIIEIVDHHKVNMSLINPIRIDVKPLGSTNTLVYELCETNNVAIDNDVKKLMLSAILSDTQGLKSSTTTEYDSKVASSLSKELNIKLDELIFEIFKAKSDLTGLSPRDIVKKDFKIFNFNKYNVFINQVETVEPNELTKQKEELIKALENIKTSENVDQTYLVITDILNVNSQVIYVTDEEKHVIEKAFSTKGVDNVADIGPKTSRKKDIAPAIEKALY